MKRQPWVNFTLAGMSLTDFGLIVPSPFCSLELTNSEITSVTSWTLTCTVGGDDKKKVNSAAFEALLYSAAQSSYQYNNASGIPVSFAFGWLSPSGDIDEYVAYQGFTLTFKVNQSGRFLVYSVTGYASLMTSFSAPVLQVPAVCGWCQPSAMFVGFAKATKVTNYYDLDVDRNDAVTYVQHGGMTTSFFNYVNGSYSNEDNYETFPGLVKLSRSYNLSREAAGLVDGCASLRSITDNVPARDVGQYLKPSWTDSAVQATTFAFWVDEPTATQRGCLHYKSYATLRSRLAADALQFGTADTNVISISGSYNGVAYNMTNMRFADIGFNLDGSGQSIVNDATVVNSWSANAGDVYQTASIINDVNAIASQFSGEFTVDIPGSVKTYRIAQAVPLIVMSGNTLSPITGMYNIVSVAHKISNTFVTSLKLQRFTMSSANAVAASQGILIDGTQQLLHQQQPQTPNIRSPYDVDYGIMYPTFDDMWHGPYQLNPWEDKELFWWWQ